jgi:hypothetical protein
MPDIKLAKLADRTPVKVTVTMMPELAQALTAYGEIYRQAYGREEPLSELIPAMLASFLESDRAFVKARRGATPPPLSPPG